jgi:hypothetical protein
MFKINGFQKFIIKNNQNIKKLQRLESTATHLQSKTVENKNTKIEAQSNVGSTNEPSKKPVTFAKLFKDSKFVSLGNLQNKIFVGRIVDVNGDDLYIDYGGKFNCVCKKPLVNSKY